MPWYSWIALVWFAFLIFSGIKQLIKPEDKIVLFSAIGELISGFTCILLVLLSYNYYITTDNNMIFMSLVVLASILLMFAIYNDFKFEKENEEEERNRLAIGGEAGLESIKSEQNSGKSAEEILQSAGLTAADATPPSKLLENIFTALFLIPNFYAITLGVMKLL